MLCFAVSVCTLTAPCAEQSEERTSKVDTQSFFLEWEIEDSIHDFDFTKRSIANLRRITDSEAFRQQDTKTILQYLQNEMEIVSFSDFLKRFLYEKAELQLPYSEVSDAVYSTLIQDSFARNHAPHAFSQVTSRWSSIVHRWLTSASVERNTVFLLGFGLQMTDEEVSLFLTKVLKEDDFRFTDPVETVYWHCFHRALPYAEALALRDAVPPSNAPLPGPAFFSEAPKHPQAYLIDREQLLVYLSHIRDQQSALQTTDETFDRLYQCALAAVTRTLPEEEIQTIGDTSGAAKLETALYSGVPRTGKNLASTARSLLAKQLGHTRLTRQRIGRLLHGEKPTRFDLLTLLFLIHSAKSSAPKDRFSGFIDEANDVLRACGMFEVYPVHPYESFLLMCLLTEDPLYVFNDVWESSYES